MRVIELIRELGVGQAIPSERRLSGELGVSRLTLRAALDELVREGYLVRRHGSGTFVSEPKIAQQLTLTSFSEDMRRRGMTAGSKTIELRETHAGAAVGRALNVSPDARVVLIRRLRLADGEPNPTAALALIQEAIRIDPYNEDVYQHAMRLHATLNNADGITRTLRTLTERLADLEVDVPPQTQQVATDLLAALEARRRRHGNAA